MSRQSIKLEAIDPIEIYGPANKNLEALCGYFPELKVVARGNEIILDGKEKDVEDFTVKLHMLIDALEVKKLEIFTRILLIENMILHTDSINSSAFKNCVLDVGIVSATDAAKVGPTEACRLVDA